MATEPVLGEKMGTESQGCEEIIFHCLFLFSLKFSHVHILKNIYLRGKKTQETMNIREYS